MTSRAVQLDGVSFESAEGTAILSEIDWSLEAGRTAAIIGPSGSGKSTLVRLINRLDDPTSGTVSVLGRPARDWPPRGLRTQCVWVPQSPAQFQGSVADYLAIPVALGVVSPSEADERIAGALDTAHFDRALEKRDVTRLSGGERQRLALARALLLAPQILILDEPTSSLDGENANLVLDSLKGWQKEAGRTLIIVTHRLADVHLLGGELLMLESGRVRHSGAAAEILDSDAGDDIRRVLAGEAAR